MAYAQARELDQTAIPVVDIRPLADGPDPEGVAQALHAASQNLGFIYIKGHDIPSDIIESARAAAKAFFNSDDADKAKLKISKQHRGWLGPGHAKMQDDIPVDLKESFVWGYQDEFGSTPENHPLRGVNQWPDFVPELEQAAMTYFQHAHQLAFQLMRGFALGLALDEDFFLRHCQQPLSRASFVYYPPQPESAGEDHFGVGPHTDFGVLTVLCQDDVGGLQVQTVDGEWIHAPPIEGTLLVNVGDLLARWTGGAYKSTPHRVVNTSGKERLSLVLAFDPEPDTLIDATDVFGADYSAAQEAITCGDYLIWRFAKAFSYRTTQQTEQSND